MTGEPFTRSYRRQEGRRPFVLGHRGARAVCPENTMMAFERAMHDGADGVELDVRMSADGELFITHDDRLNTIHGKVALSRLSRTQIRSLKMEHGQPVPTLKEVLHFQARTGAYLNVELKGDVLSPLWMARRAASMIQQHGGVGVVLSSFHAMQVVLLRRLLPRVPVGILYDQSQKTLAKALPLFRYLGVQAAHPEAGLLNEESVLKLRRDFALINTWTINDPSEAQRAAALGVDAIITDDPAAILAALR